MPKKTQLKPGWRTIKLIPVKQPKSVRACISVGMTSFDLVLWWDNKAKMYVNTKPRKAA